jgi:hypothetical protein
VISFFEKTWFLWWILATLFILLWFHRFSSHPEMRAVEAVDSGEEEEGVTASKEIPSGTASRLFT